MKFTYNWLKQYVDFDWSPPELAEKLTFAGIEVEEVQTLGGKIPPQVVIAQILASEKHPNADKLTVCRVNDGSLERQIVCGAKNYQVGDKVPLALPGAAMAAGFTIKESKLRGVMSQGMMCSAEELGLPKGADGLLILPADAPVGKNFAEYVGPADTLFDIEVTPNRPDWLSVIGIAREIAAMTGNPLRLPAIDCTEDTESTESLCSVKLDAPELCPRYTARVIRGVKIGPSPVWLKQALEKVGLRSINNVVDVTNYVLMEAGHPLHAFDYNLLRGSAGASPSKPVIVVRRAEAGELLTVIDGSKHELKNDMLVIADARRAVALAGVMGGQESEINDQTTDVLLESAWFLPANIRKTAKALGLSTDASYRFERGTDIEGLVWAGHRAVALIQQVAGGQIARGMVDALAQPVERKRVTCRYAQVNRLLGVEVAPAAVKKIFAGLGLAVVEGRASSRPSGEFGHDEAWPADEFVEVEVPTFRVDLVREADLIEEVCRIYGVEKIPAKMQPATAAVSAFDAQWDLRRRVRGCLAALGFHEAVNQTMVPEPVAVENRSHARLQNPLTSEMSALRGSLLPGLLANLRTNVSRHQFDVRLFEIGRVFAADGKESLNLALAMTGRRDPESWETATRGAKLDFYDLKGALEELARQFGIPGFAALEIKQISAAAAKKLDLRDEVVTAETDLNALLASAEAEKQFVELPKFPAVVRDMALVVDEAVPHGAIVAAIEGNRNKFLEKIELFDIFRGSSIPSGKKSLAYSLTFRAADRTLTDVEVNAAHEQLKRQLQQQLQCEIRES